MRLPHEYSIVGHSRALVGKYLGTIAAACASAGALLAAIIFRLLHAVGDAPAVVTWPLTGGTVFFVFHYLFNTQVWKWPQVVKWLRIPDLNGAWDVTGKTLNDNKDVIHEWSGTIVITQTWEKISVLLTTERSSSFSISAALRYEPGSGFRLLYNYRNDPGVEQRELATHAGFCELLFSDDLRSANGDYFNSKGRNTFGTMHLKRKA